MLAFRDLSIRYKLTLLLLGVVGIVLMAVSVANVISQVQSSRVTIAAKYSTLAKLVAAQSGAALSIADVDSSGAQQIMSDLAAEPSIRSAALFNAQGKEVVRHPADSHQPLQPPEDLGAAFTSAGFLDVVDEIRLADGSVIGKIYLSATTDQLHAQIRRTVAIAIIVFLIALVITVLLSLALQRLISTPILRLAQLAQRVSAEHDYSLRAETRGSDELGTLCNGFNTMLAEIRRREDELGRHRMHLEELVVERTQVLQARTEELTRSNDDLTRSRGALEVANKELEAFSYSVSHDLRAPLRAIDGFSRILMDEYVAALPEDAQKYLSNVRAGAQKMGHLVDDLLEFSRLSRQALKKEPVAFEQIVNECIEELRAELNGRRVDVRVGALPVCMADQALFKQVWTNLLSNAFKYTGQREAALIEVGSHKDNGHGTTYFVKDNGAGFDMRYSSKLFGVFQRLHKAEDFPGTGVGLAIVQRIIERHGGRIWAESRLNQGTTFFFTLPEQEAPK